MVRRARIAGAHQQHDPRTMAAIRARPESAGHGDECRPAGIRWTHDQRPVAFKTQPESSKETGTHYEALPERAERVAGLAMRVACLRKTPNAQKRIAFILTNASGKAAQIGNAVGLDAPASLMKILHAMQAHGYRIEGLPDASDQLMQQLINQGSYDEDFLTAEQMRAAVARVPADQYAQWFDALPAEPRQ